jgi:hypothetical protein
MPTVTDAKATIVTLPELAKESQVIVYGHIDVAKDPSLATGLQFRATQVLKGESSVHEGVIPLCNARPNTEWPDLSKLTGDAVLFLSPRGECFNLSHNYRSVIHIHGDRASTLVLEGEPEDQSLDGFLERVRKLVPKQT